jgi:hypothetical protein
MKKNYFTGGLELLEQWPFFIGKSTRDGELEIVPIRNILYLEGV